MKSLCLFFYMLLVSLIYVKCLHKDLSSHRNYYLIDHGEDCGGSLSNRIVGGKDATLGQYPWIVLIGYYNYTATGMEEFKILCGGTVLSDRYVLSAAHCPIPQIELLKVLVGEHRLSTNPDCELGICAPPPQVIPVEEVIDHEEYTKQRYGLDFGPYDVRLIRLKTPIIFNEYASPICLPVSVGLEDLSGKWVEVAGWGVTNSFARNTSDVLQRLRIKVLAKEECGSLFKKDMERNFNVTNLTMVTLFCAGGVMHEDTCDGDSGGPVMVPIVVGRLPRYFIIGVISFGLRFCGYRPGYYTDIFTVLEWILDHLR